MVALPIAAMPSPADMDHIYTLRRQQELVRRFTIPERAEPPRPPELLKPSRIITTRKYERWTHKLKGFDV